MHNLLNAPCIFCGYNGEGYYQAGTHSANCPWYNIGGDSKRYGKLPSLITALFKESQKTPTNKQSVQCTCKRISCGNYGAKNKCNKVIYGCKDYYDGPVH